jgi:hypothetical protein
VSETTATSVAPAPSWFGLGLRPEVDPAVLAVLAVAANEVWPRRQVELAAEPSRSPMWRFSGRWWTKPAAARRDRPRT